jgi:hypothetical protein
VVNLEIKFLKNPVKEFNRRKAKATSKIILENNSIIPVGVRDRLTLRKLRPAYGKESLSLEDGEHLLGHQ